MTWRVRNALRLFLSVQWRCRFPHVYLALAIPTILVFRLAIPGEFAESLVPAFLFGEPGTLALMLAAAQAYLERSERSVTALVVTPLRSGEYILGLVLATAVVATLAGAAVQAGVVGVDRRLVLLIPPLFLTATLAGFLGLGLSAFFAEFTRFLIAGLMPAMLVLSLPYASYFGLVPRIAFAWVPSDAALFSLANLVRPDPDALRYAAYGALLICYNVIAFRWARRLFRTRVRERLAEA